MKYPEKLLATRVANFIRTTYPETIYRFDLASDMPLPPVHAKRNKELHGKWTKGFVDLVVYEMRNKFGAFLIELKATEKLVKSEHTKRQAQYHELLRSKGYRVCFCFKYNDCISKIKEYMDN